MHEINGGALTVPETHRGQPVSRVRTLRYRFEIQINPRKMRLMMDRLFLYATIRICNIHTYVYVCVRLSEYVKSP